MEKQPELNRQGAQLVLRKVLEVAGHLHPAARRGLEVEAKRLWLKAGIAEPVPIVQESPRRRALREYRRRQRKRGRDRLTLRLRGK